MAIKNIILDPGHGGLDSNGKYTTAPGKMFKFPNGEIAYEGVLNRNIAKFVYQCFKANPEYNVLYTVEPDDATDVPLNDRVKFTNNFKPKETLFISIHCNAGGGQGTGFEIFTTKGPTKSDSLAEHIANSVETAYNKVSMKLRYDFSDGDKDKDKESDFYVLRNTNCPAVLLECGFFDNRKDFDLLKDPKFQGDLGSFIYSGILNYISNEKNN